MAKERILDPAALVLVALGCISIGACGDDEGANRARPD
jgi:hypothetical protein